MTINQGKYYLALSVAMLMSNQVNALNCKEDCCRIRKLYSDLGGTVRDSKTCCQVPGVSCNEQNQVDKIAWYNKNLVGSIPSYISELTALEFINMKSNKLNGTIPPSITDLALLKELNLARNNLEGSLPDFHKMENLERLWLRKNARLNGSLIASKDSFEYAIYGTGITVCGKRTQKEIPGLFPKILSEADLKCLVILAPTKIQARATRISQSTPYGYFTCSRNETTLSPFQDCMNLIGVFCQTTSPVFSNWDDCHLRINSVRDQLNTNWKNWLNRCANWLGGNPSSAACTAATSTLLRNEIYYWYDENKVMKTSTVPESVTNAVKFIWST